MRTRRIPRIYASLSDHEKELAMRLEAACFQHVQGVPIHAVQLKHGDFNEVTYVATDMGETFGVVYVAEQDADLNAMSAIAPPSATLMSTTGLASLLYILDGTTNEIAQVKPRVLATSPWEKGGAKA